MLRSIVLVPNKIPIILLHKPNGTIEQARETEGGREKERESEEKKRLMSEEGK